jgi:hypothetical protein
MHPEAYDGQSDWWLKAFGPELDRLEKAIAANLVANLRVDSKGNYSYFYDSAAMASYYEYTDESQFMKDWQPSPVPETLREMVEGR